MPRFAREDFQQVLEKVGEGSIAPVYVLYGEDYLVKSALAQLTETLIPETQQSTNLEVVDGSQADFRAILESVNTFSLFSGRKVVVVQDSRIFYSRTNLPALFAKSKETYEADDVEGAARLLLEVLSYAGWSLNDVSGGAWREIPADLWQQAVGVEQEQDEMGWLETVIEHANSREMEVPRRQDDASLLEQALAEGFPAEQCLLLSTDTVDKRRSLYRLIEDKGVVVDLSVASGTSRQVRSQQETILRDLAEETLSKAGKRIEPGALALLLERTGFNLWALKTQIEKLISFVGDEMIITLEQVEGMSAHFREEPLYQLNNAVAACNQAEALRILNRLLDQNYHSLQLLGSLANHIRRLLMAREFIDEYLAGNMDTSISYGRFQKNILPLIKEKASQHSPLATMHPFALHQAMIRSTSFHSADLINSLYQLLGADVTLKSSGISERAVMESLILRICQPHKNDTATK